MSKETNLRIWQKKNEEEIHHLPERSARGCQQILTLSGKAHQRNLEGKLVETENFPLFYTSEIKGQDTLPPAFEPLFFSTSPLDPVWVDCIVSLLRPALLKTKEVQLERPPVPESVFLVQGHKETQLEASTIDTENKTVKYPAISEPGTFIRYRPRLKMIPKTIKIHADEWNLTEGWTLSLEEA